MNWLLPFLAASLMASCHPAHAATDSKLAPQEGDGYAKPAPGTR